MKFVEQLGQCLRNDWVDLLPNVVSKHRAAIDGMDRTRVVIVRQEIRETGVAAVVPLVERDLVADVVVAYTHGTHLRVEILSKRLWDPVEGGRVKRAVPVVGLSVGVERASGVDDAGRDGNAEERVSERDGHRRGGSEANLRSDDSVRSRSARPPRSRGVTESRSGIRAKPTRTVTRLQRHRLSALALTVALSTGCTESGRVGYQAPRPPVEAPLAGEVDPFIGTAADGMTFPGALVPWGMASPSPHTKLTTAARSEERRGGKEGRSRWSP